MKHNPIAEEYSNILFTVCMVFILPAKKSIKIYSTIELKFFLLGKKKHFSCAYIFALFAFFGIINALYQLLQVRIPVASLVIFVIKFKYSAVCNRIPFV